MTVAIYSIIGLIVGAVVVFFIMNSKTKAQESMLNAKNEQVESKENEIKELKDRNERISSENTGLVKENSSLKTRNDGLQEQIRTNKEDMEKQFNAQLDTVKKELQIAYGEALKQNREDLEKGNKTNISDILAPVKESIDKLKQSMNDTSQKQAELSAAVKTELEHATKMSTDARNSAEMLTKALRHGTKVQGDWGETVLNELLESQGLRNGVHYDTQATMRDGHGNVINPEGGSRLRPDVILHLDHQREVIIDSKVSLTAFIDYVNAENDADRAKALKDHVASLKKHVDELSKKDYSSYIMPPKSKIDYVIMFVPHSGALLTALNEQPNLWREAMEKNVYIADDQTLYAALRIISLTWTQIKQAEQHQEVYNLANEMLNRVGQFMKSFEKIGSELGSATNAYNDAKGKLSPGGQSILQTCGKLQTLGAKQSTTNPIHQIDNFEEQPILLGEKTEGN